MDKSADSQTILNCGPGSPTVVGLISDVQCSYHSNRMNYQGTAMRYYRQALDHLRYALQTMSSGIDEQRVSLVLSLGDLLDGVCYRDGHAAEILSEIQRFFQEHGFGNEGQIPVIHVVGNHDLYNFSRDQLTDLSSPVSQLYIPKIVRPLLHKSGAWPLQEENGLNAANHRPLYYALHDMVPHWSILVLDGFDLSVLGLPEGHPHLVQCQNFLAARNSNSDKNEPGDVDRWYTAYNGGLGPRQMRWLEEELQRASDLGLNVALASHVVLDREIGMEFNCLMWNHVEVSALLARFAHCVRLMLSGHTHVARLRSEDLGGHYLWHLVHPSMLEMGPSVGGEPARKPHSLLKFYQDSVTLLGAEGLPDLTFIWPKKRPTS